MHYPRLYAAFQNCDLHVGRNAVRDAVLNAMGINRVRIVADPMDTTICRGMYFSPQNLQHKFTCLHGQHVIVVARDMSRCWQRLVVVKELMHMLDGHNSATDTGEAFEKVVNEFTGSGTTHQCPQTKAEFRAFWMALGLLVPEKHRQALKVEWLQRSHEDPDNAELHVANKLRIPQVHIQSLFSKTFEEEVSSAANVTFRPRH